MTCRDCFGYQDCKTLHIIRILWNPLVSYRTRGYVGFSISTQFFNLTFECSWTVCKYKTLYLYLDGKHCWLYLYLESRYIQVWSQGTVKNGRPNGIFSSLKKPVTFAVSAKMSVLPRLAICHFTLRRLLFWFSFQGWKERYFALRTISKFITFFPHLPNASSASFDCSAFGLATRNRRLCTAMPTT